MRLEMFQLPIFSFPSSHNSSALRAIVFTFQCSPLIYDERRTNGSAFPVVYCSTNLSETRDFLTYTKLQRMLWYTHWIKSIWYGSMSSTLLRTHILRVLDLRRPFRYLLGQTHSWITAVSISIQDNFRVYSYSLYLQVYWNWNWVLYYLLVHLQLTGYIMKKTISLKPGVWMGKHIDYQSTDKC